MKFTLSWLKEFLDTDANLDQIAETLTAIGLEVEGIENPAEDFAAFKVAYIAEAGPHPDADKLQICRVQTEQGEFQVVCGAPNAKGGMYGVFAPEGAYVPGLDVTLKKTKIRGVESCGMMVSEREMQLSDEHEGIIELEGEYEIGTPMADVFGLNDPVIEINVTPNRADCAGVYGIARDLAAAGLGTLKTPVMDDIKTGGVSPVTVDIKDDDGCPLFFGCMIKGVKNGPSPDWLQRRLKAVGLRPISALVDITNYFTVGFARPLHVYDADRLRGNITVSTAKGGEELEALNDKSYTLRGGETTIEDESGVIGLGGIVGGTSTGSEDDTVNVFLECAYFTPERIARTGRDLGVISDARYRFERGVDPEFTKTGIELATGMILDLCGGQASDIVQAGNVPEWKREIEYTTSYTEELIGVAVDPARQKEILTALGFDISGNGDLWRITPPSWRGDVFGKADIVEEVIRIEGFENIPEISVRDENTIPYPAETITLSRARKARGALAARGLNECVTWSFLSAKQAASFGANDNLAALTLKNPISSELNVMRPSILPNLLLAAAENANRGYPNVALSEVGPVFENVKPDGQNIVAAGIRAGQMGDKHWSGENASRAPDLYDVKADVLAVLAACGVAADNAPISRDAGDYFHPGRSGCIRLGRNVLAQFGELHPALLEEMGIKGRACGFEIYLENIPEPKNKGSEKPYLTLEPLQPVKRDFAFIVDENVAANDLIRAAMAGDKKRIESAAIFDVYQGKGVDEGKKSVALSVTIQPRGESLTDKDLEAIMQGVIETVSKKCGGVLRG